MTTDYESLLRVTEDGHIWWLLKDAIRLGAGYRPYSDDNLTLEPALRAPSKRALANERTLICAFSDARLAIAQPMTFERDGFRYVDAEGFLDWLSLYITQTQAKITFPDELASEVRKTKAKAAASQSPTAGQNFESLTLALEAWFDRPSDALPKELRCRMEQDFLAPWDDLAPAQRRSVALQWDYHNDPATQAQRKSCWGFYQKIDAIKQRIAEWEVAPAPTASDLALKEARLKELRQELARMALQERQTGGDYYPAQTRLDGADEAPPTPPASPVPYIPYPKAMKLLAKRLGATPEELAAWVWIGPEDGGLAAYRNANELDPPPRFHFWAGNHDPDYLSPLMACWFKEDDISTFEPTDRYITGKMLVERWSQNLDIQPEAFILAKIAESRLLDFHPIYGGTQSIFPKFDSFPPMESGLFVLAQVEAIEAEDFGVDEERGKSVDMPTTDTEADEHPVLAVSGSPCNIFLAMKNLNANELTVTFVGDKSETELGANNMMDISARKETRRVALATLELVDRRRGGANSKGLILLGMAQKKTLLRTEKNAATMTRLRKVFRDHLGISTDPFEPYHKGSGWMPLFTIADNRGAADERAKREAERRTVSYDEFIESGGQFADTNQQDQFLDSDDAAAKWLKEKGHGELL